MIKNNSSDFPKMQKLYRPEIDGLRAFAIIAVIINHFNKELLPTGYLGVDIFFVISGYVICSSISKRKSLNFRDFILSFFERRVRRLIPALIFFVLITSLLISFFSPQPYGKLGTGFASLFGVSNIALFWKSKDYFSEIITLNPFTHTWSLGVEEQFYFFLPFIAWSTGFAKGINSGEKRFLFFILFCSIVSLIFFIKIYPYNQPAAYFLMPLRLWEIGSGCIVFILSNKYINTFKKFEAINSSLILLTILMLMKLNLSSVFSTLIIVILTCLLIVSFKQGTFLYKLLTKKVSIFIGMISYSLYLWHWGILSISRWTIGIHWWSVPFQLILIFLISLFSFKYIEKPFREKKFLSGGYKVIMESAIISIISGTFLIILAKPLNGKLFLGNNQEKNSEMPYFESGNITQEFCVDWDEKGINIEEIFKKCMYRNKNSNQTLWFVGDSHTYSIWLGAEYVAKKTNSDIGVFNINGHPFPSLNLFRKSKKNDQLKRHKLFTDLSNKILDKANKKDIIFIYLRMPYHFGDEWYQGKYTKFVEFGSNKVYSKRSYFKKWLEALESFSKLIDKKGVSIVLFYPTPEFPYALTKQCREQNPNWFNYYSKKDCSAPIEFFNSENGKYNFMISEIKKLEKMQKNIYLFNSLSALCPESNCTYSYENNKLYRDDDHLSNYAARFIIAPELIKLIEINKLLP